MRFTSLMLCCAALLSFMLTGCAPKSKIPEFHAQYYPQCYDPIAKLCKDQDHTGEAKGAALGALIGGLGGALVGGLSSGNAKGALIGAGVGAVAGGLTGYFSARLQKIKDREQRLVAYQNILGESSRGWDLERASVERAYKCYGEQIRLLKNLARNKQIRKDEFLARMNEIKAGINNINTYWANAQNRMNSNLADGEAFLQQQEAEDRKLAAAKRQRAQQQIAEQRRRTQRQRTQMNNDITATNKAKDTTVAELNDLNDFANNVLQAMLDQKCNASALIA